MKVSLFYVFHWNSKKFLNFQLHARKKTSNSSNFTYRTNQSICCWRDNMQRSVDILVILSHVEHHAFTKRWRNSLSFNRNTIFIHRQTVVNHNVILFVAVVSKEKGNFDIIQLAMREILNVTLFLLEQRQLSLCLSSTAIKKCN